jgi:hypothetical protein
MKSDYERKKDRVVVLTGAGASILFGYPTQKTIWRFLIENTTSSIRRNDLDYVRNYYGDDIERGLTLLELYQAEERLSSLRNTIGRAFLKYTPREEGVRVMGRALKVLQNSFEHVCFATANWDIGIETTLRELGRQYNYYLLFDEPSSLNAGVPLLKLHGSASWRFCPKCSKLLCSEDVPGELFTHKLEIQAPGLTYKNESLAPMRLSEEEFVSGVQVPFKASPPLAQWGMFPRGHILHHGAPSIEDECPLCHLSGLETILTLPSFFKKISLQYLDTVHRAADRMIRNAGTLIVIGYSFRSADYDLLYLVDRLLGGVGVTRVIVFGELEVAQALLQTFKIEQGPRQELALVHAGMMDENMEDTLDRALQTLETASLL